MTAADPAMTALAHSWPALSLRSRRKRDAETLRAGSTTTSPAGMGRQPSRVVALPSAVPRHPPIWMRGTVPCLGEPAAYLSALSRRHPTIPVAPGIPSPSILNVSAAAVRRCRNATPSQARVRRTGFFVATERLISPFPAQTTDSLYECPRLSSGIEWKPSPTRSRPASTNSGSASLTSAVPRTFSTCFPSFSSAWSDAPEGCGCCRPVLLAGAPGPSELLVHPASRATDNTEAQRMRLRPRGCGVFFMNWSTSSATRPLWWAASRCLS